MGAADTVPAFSTYLFDLDGTLVDSAPDLTGALCAALEAGGLAPVSESATRDWVGHGARVLLERAIAAQQRDIAHAAVDAMHRHFLAHYAEHIADRSRPYPQVTEALRALAQRGAQLAVVTNKPQRLSVQLLEALDLMQWFPVVIGGDSASRAKPDAAPAALACEQLGVAPSSVLFVGDSATDVGCARAFGVPVACVRYGYRGDQPLDALAADWLIDSLASLL
ncbi:MAG: phosphoglycolate phosphatase [Pseudomonadota bacterium]